MSAAIDRYSVMVNWSDEDTSYIARCVEFPGVSAHGETREEAISELEAALGLAIETYEERHWPLPEPHHLPAFSGQFRVRMSRTLHARLAELAESEGVSLNTLVNTYLAEKAGIATERTKEQQDQRKLFQVARTFLLLSMLGPTERTSSPEELVRPLLTLGESHG